MSARTHILPDAATAADHCSTYILGLLEEVLAGQEQATLAISGGSTPKLLFDRMASRPFPWSRLHLFFVDERHVPPTDPGSNYKLAEEHLIAPAKIPRSHVHRVRTESNPQHAAEAYTDDIREFFESIPGELPHFDAVEQGLGPDAHTASLFPGEPLIEDRSGIAAAVFNQEKKQWRITLLPGVLLAAKHNVFLVAGQDKAEAVRNVFEADYEPSRYPAQIVAHHGRSVSWFLDREAGALLKAAER